MKNLALENRIVTTRKKSLAFHLKRDWALYVLLLPILLLTLIFCYLPMPGLIISFMDYDVFLQFSSPWVGLDNIKTIIETPMFGRAILNTLLMSALNLLIIFPAPILFAILLNELKNVHFKKLVQTVSYLPNFLSWVAVIGIAMSFYSIYGPLNDFLVKLGGEGTERIYFLTKQGFFVPNVLILNLWKTFGWDSIIFLAAITGLDMQLFEAARIDGAGRFRQIIHITIPGIMPTAVILLILKMGSFFNDNFELIYGLQNPYIDFEVISTLVYKNGIVEGNYSLATAFGFMQGLISFLLMIIANKFAGKVSGISVW